MLTLYYNEISMNSRRVWMTLLEKHLDFDLVNISLDKGEQLQPEFLAMNPFHQIPVLVDDGFNVVESLAIVDYVEAKYPNPSLLPADPQNLAIVRMVENITVNELIPAMNPIIYEMLGAGYETAKKLEQAKQKIALVLEFLENLLGDRLYFGNDEITLADIVACPLTFLPTLLDMPLTQHPKLDAWVERLMQRPSWQTTQPTPEVLEAYKPRAKARMQALLAASR